jgi:threonine synthase
MKAYILECIDCGRHHLPDSVEYLCPECASKVDPMEPLPGLLRCIYDYEVLSKQFDPEVLERREEQGLERWVDLLPIESAESLPPLITSATPLRYASRLGREIGMEDLWLKDDTGLPTSSFKDRASSLVVACAREREYEIIATASTGNAATALAGMAASVDMESVIFVPANAPQAKLVQIAVYGAKLVPIDGNYDQAFALSMEACEKFGWYCRNTGFNPYTVEGKKSAALEIWEQLDYTAPDWVVVPTGDGVILAGIEKGFSDLAAMGLIDRIPKLAAVQADGCKPIVDAYERGDGVIKPELSPKSVADSIAVGVPRAGRWALQALKKSSGVAVAVSDDEILEAIRLIGTTSGVFAEPAAASSIAGLKKLVADGVVGEDERVVALITGNGLKDVPAAARSISFPEKIAPRLDAIEKFIKS